MSRRGAGREHRTARDGGRSLVALTPQRDCSQRLTLLWDGSQMLAHAQNFQNFRPGRNKCLANGSTSQATHQDRYRTCRLTTNTGS
jgi:hypothetical protein